MGFYAKPKPQLYLHNVMTRGSDNLCNMLTETVTINIPDKNDFGLVTDLFFTSYINQTMDRRRFSHVSFITAGIGKPYDSFMHTMLVYDKGSTKRKYLTNIINVDTNTYPFKIVFPFKDIAHVGNGLLADESKAEVTHYQSPSNFFQNIISIDVQLDYSLKDKFRGVY